MLLLSHFFKFKSFLTLKMYINSIYKVFYTKIKSYVLFCRPIIFKEYTDLVEIFYG